MTFGELEVLKKNASHFDKNITQIFYKEDKIIFFVSNILQESIKDAKILPALSSAYSTILFSLVSTELSSKGKGLWKFNNPPLLNEEFVTKLRNYIHKLMKWPMKILMTIKFDGNFLNTETENFSENFLKFKQKSYKRSCESLKTNLSYMNQI